jgi:hypothetical protein
VADAAARNVPGRLVLVGQRLRACEKILGV